MGGGLGRAPCCDKSKVKKGPWSPAEDFRLISFIQKQGHGNWRALPKQAGLLRCGKSCRLRWINYLRPDVKRGNLTPEEEETIINLHNTMGNKWSKIASHLPGRTDNEIKNVWNTHLKKRLINRNDASCRQTESKYSLKCCSASPSPSSSSCISYGDLNSDKGHSGDQEQKESNADQNQDPLGQVEEVLKPVKETSSLNNCNANAPSEVRTSLNDQKIKEMEAADGIIEIPLESDADFWNMLDGFDPMESGESQPQECEVSQSSNFGEDYREGVEHKKWLRYLENELGLVGGNDGDRPGKGTEQQQQLVTKTSDNEMILRPEIDPAMAYFSMWPSSPQHFGI